MTIAIASTQFLFLLRVRAVYLRSKYLTTIFGGLLLVVVSLVVLAAVLTPLSQ